MKFRKKPVVIEAIRWMTDNYDQIVNFIPEEKIYPKQSGELIIGTLEGEMICSPFDWIIKGVKGEFYPCKPDIFEATYERFEP